jgi:ADP-ribosyl-[dinitrogen reductase] hydrolase
MELSQRYRGALLGLASGDALGTTLEFKPAGSFTPLTEMQGGGPFRLALGQWTDDTSMALCLAASLCQCQGFDPDDQMRRYLRWYRQGEWSSTGHCFDIGNTVRTALLRFERGHNAFAGERDPRCGGNGSLMRLAPVPLAFAQHPAQAVRYASAMSRTTHAASEPVDACRYYTALLLGALQGEDKATLLAPNYAPIGVDWDRYALAPRIAVIAAGSYKQRHPPEIRGTGYVVQSLEAALWAFYHTDDFAAGALAAVNLGDDADTTGAIYGQLAGAYYGVEAIPSHWRRVLALRARIEAMADNLQTLAASLGASAAPDHAVD